MSARDITCDEVLEQLFAYLDGELSADQLATIEHHLEHCRDCFSRAEFERKLRAKVAEAAQAAAPDRLHRRVRMLMRRF